MIPYPSLAGGLNHLIRTAEGVISTALGQCVWRVLSPMIPIDCNTVFMFAYAGQPDLAFGYCGHLDDLRQS